MRSPFLALLAIVALVACGGASTRAVGPASAKPPAAGDIALDEPEATPTPAPSPTPAPLPVAAPPPPAVVTINAVGDVMLERDIIGLMDQYGSTYPYEAVRDLLSDADVTIANMEGTFT